MAILIPPPLCDMVQDVYGPHADNVALLSSRLAFLLGQDVALACAAGYLHDLGKTLIPRAVLDKEAALNQEEWSLMQQHPEFGFRLLAEYWPDAPDEVVQAVVGHHERLDGSGYPYGSCVMLPLTSIVAAADVYDALSSSRSYRKAPVPSPLLEHLLLGQALPSDVLRALSSLLNMDFPRLCDVRAG